MTIPNLQLLIWNPQFLGCIKTRMNDALSFSSASLALPSHSTTRHARAAGDDAAENDQSEADAPSVQRAATFPWTRRAVERGGGHQPRSVECRPREQNAAQRTEAMATK